jgi:hypothetical protein
MQQCLVFATFAEIEKGSGLFYLYPAIKQLGHRIFVCQMKVGPWNMVKAMQAYPFLLFNELIPTDCAEPGEKEFSQIE